MFLSCVSVCRAAGLSPEQLAGMDAACAQDEDGQVNIKFFVDKLCSEY